MSDLTERPATTFPAPDDHTASAPPEWRGLARDEGRLLVATPDGLVHARFRDLPAHLQPGDLLVVNNTATVAGEADAVWRGRPVVLHVATDLTEPRVLARRTASSGSPNRAFRTTHEWVVELRTAPDAAVPILEAAPGDTVSVGSISMTLQDPYPHVESSPTRAGNRLWRAVTDADLRWWLDRFGRPIAYGYLDRRYPLADYQSVFAVHPGSAEMASAGRPFTPELVTRLVSLGVGIAPITLHTGVSSQEAGEGPQAEWFDVPPMTARAVNSTKAAGGRIVAVGTTVTRALESAADQPGVRAASGWTERVVTPSDPPRVVDGLITGWHDPQASHLLLVEAVAGRRLTQSAYAAASSAGYLWHEFGDSALLLR